jgi:flagellar hook protein FlgE
MFSAISGLRAHQTMMDVTGNNVANVNTTGYKSTRATFTEALTQVMRGATAPVPAAAGGTNPYQIGLGANVAGIDQNFAQGSSQSTGRASDVAINGDGFFQVQANGDTFYSRAGAFSWDASGQLTTTTGLLVLGTPADGSGPGNPLVLEDPADGAAVTDPTIGQDGSITARRADGTAVVIGTIDLASFVNPNGLERVGDGLFRDTVNSGDPELGRPGDGIRGSLQAGTLEMSNVDLAQEFTNLIIAQRGFQANSRTITASDEILQDLVNMKR